MCNNVTGKVLKGKGFVKKDVWTKELEEGTIILTKDGDSLFFPKFEKKGTSKDSCYDVFCFFFYSPKIFFCSVL